VHPRAGLSQAPGQVVLSFPLHVLLQAGNPRWPRRPAVLPLHLIVRAVHLPETGRTPSTGEGSEAGEGRAMTTPAEQPVAQPAAPADRLVPSARSISPWTTRQKIARVLWMFVRATLFRWSFHNWYAWRVMLLRLFGAKLGHAVRIRPTVSIEIPWNLEIGADTGIGDHAILYSL